MSEQFFPIQVENITKSTPDCSIITFKIPDELKSQFAYQQGQYLTLKTEINGESVRRSYSLCSSPLDNVWKIGVKKVDGGKFSTFANDILKVGDTIRVAPPNGRFHIEINKEKQKNYIAFAAGSGITPVISIIKTHLQAEPNSTFRLFYVNQTVSSIILKEELEALKNKYMERFEIFYFLTKQQRSIPLLNGRLDRDKLQVIFKTICHFENIDDYFICGPQQMIFMIRDYLMENNVIKSNIHLELFTTDDSQPAVRKKIAEQLKGKISDVTIVEGGKTINFKMEQGSNTLLDASLDNAADLPFACKGGVCCTCRAKLMKGKVEMPVCYGLEEDEIESGYILTCQAIPTSDIIIVDFDV